MITLNALLLYKLLILTISDMTSILAIITTIILTIITGIIFLIKSQMNINKKLFIEITKIKKDVINFNYIHDRNLEQHQYIINSIDDLKKYLMK